MQTEVFFSVYPQWLAALSKIWFHQIWSISAQVKLTPFSFQIPWKLWTSHLFRYLLKTRVSKIWPMSWIWPWNLIIWPALLPVVLNAMCSADLEHAEDRLEHKLHAELVLNQLLVLAPVFRIGLWAQFGPQIGPMPLIWLAGLDEFDTPALKQCAPLIYQGQGGERNSQKIIHEFAVDWEEIRKRLTDNISKLASLDILSNFKKEVREKYMQTRLTCLRELVNITK